jgi:hypothetical protein
MIAPDFDITRPERPRSGRSLQSATAAIGGRLEFQIVQGGLFEPIGAVVHGGDDIRTGVRETHQKNQNAGALVADPCKSPRCLFLKSRPTPNA